METVPGIFRRIAKRAETSRSRSTEGDAITVAGRQVFKMSIGEANNPEDAHLFEEAMKGEYALLGFEDIDWSDEKYADREAFIEACKTKGHTNIDARSGVVQMPYIFRNRVNKGDIVIVSKGNSLFRAIGEFTGDYEFRPRPEGEYAHRRSVRWLWVDREGVPVTEIYARGFMMKSIYLLPDTELNIPALERYLNSQQADGPADPEPFVLIIDEINRANISKVFGELITLLEPDKRLGHSNELRVRLPYSGDDFGVPSNLHILGTMNTADRSIALLDTALRRRFTFREMMPDPPVLAGAAEASELDLPRILATINERIEYLYDREHQIGHAYFTDCASRADVDAVMRHKVVPLLAEYFFEDSEKIAAVLGDAAAHDGPIMGGFLKRSVLQAPPGLEDGDAPPPVPLGGPLRRRRLRLLAADRRMIRRTIREWERISYGTDETAIPVSQADRLAAEARTSAFSGLGGEGVLEHGRKGLRARGVVGVIATPDCQLEILPKIEGAGESDVDDATLRHRLIHMLAMARDIRIDARAITQLGWQRDTILELLIRLYCSKLADAVRQGIPQQYTEQEDNLPTLRGRLDVIRQFSTLAVSPQKLACRFDSRSPDIALNQVMRAAIGKLSRLARAPDNQRALRELSFAYADISEVSPGALRWDLIVLDRMSTRWRELLSLARLFLGDRHQQTSAGPIDGFALLFEMNILFEEYVARLLARALAGTGLRVSAQGGHRNCLFEGETGRFRTRPDLIVRRGNQIAVIIDTKWKRIRRIDDPKRGVSQADVYQLMAYGQLYECSQVVLLYPHHGGLPTDPIRQRYSIARPGAPDSLFVATLDVTGPHREHQTALGELILDRLCVASAA